MKTQALFIAGLFLFVSVSKADIEEDSTYKIFSTKMGILSMVDKNNNLNVLADLIKLNGADILNNQNIVDGWGASESLMLPIDRSLDAISFTNGLQRGVKTPLSIDRLVVASGPTSVCIHQFIILDFTAKTPFVSERFGYNPDGKSCLEFVKAKWGKKESYIYLKGPLKYVYYTGGKVIGPLE